MDEREYIVLELRTAEPVNWDAPSGPSSAGGPGQGMVSGESLSVPDAAAARRDPAVAVAPLLPMKLGEPV